MGFPMVPLVRLLVVGNLQVLSGFPKAPCESPSTYPAGFLTVPKKKSLKAPEQLGGGGNSAPKSKVKSPSKTKSDSHPNPKLNFHPNPSWLPT